MSASSKFAVSLRGLVGAAVVLAGCVSAGAQAQDAPRPPARIAAIPVEKQTEAQKKVIADYIADRKAPPMGPYSAWTRSPEMMTRIRALSDYIRFQSTLPAKLRELAVLTAARTWSIQYEWAGNSKVAADSGVNAEIIKAIAEGRRPTTMDEDEDIIYNLCMELQQNKSVSDVTYDRAVKKFGEQMVIETVTTVGYYSMVGMVLNVSKTPAPTGEPYPLVALPATK